MAGETKYFKNKIQATKNTSQITKAMNMVSASKLKQAQKAISNYIDFINKIEDIVSNLVSTGDCMHPLLEKRNGNKTCYILVTSERGLAGPFNNNIYKMLETVIKEGDYILPLGGRGFNYFKKKYPMLIDSPIILRDDVRFEDILEPIILIVNKFLAKEFDSVKVIYNHFVNTLTQTPTVRGVLPVRIKQKDNLNNDIYDYEGGVSTILDKVLPLYIENTIYGLILDSKASEHAARMTAMKSASDNATKIISELELMYNRARQASITLELTDIIGGASAINS